MVFKLAQSFGPRSPFSSGYHWQDTPLQTEDASNDAFRRSIDDQGAISTSLAVTSQEQWSPVPMDDAPANSGSDTTAFDAVVVGGDPVGDPGNPYEGTVVGGIVDSGVQNINALIYGTRWTGQITYNFPDAFADYGAYSHTTSGFFQAPLQQRTAVRLILEGLPGVAGRDTAGTVFGYGSYEGVASLDLIDSGLASMAGDFVAADISVAGTNLFDGSNLATARVADFPRLDQRSDSGDIWFGNDYASYQTPLPGTYDWHTHIHELGHSMGLKHGHSSDHGPFLVALTSDRDSMEFSIMTYRSYINGPLTGYSNETYGYAQTLMMYDIATLQYLYGANFNTNSTNTTYTWSSTTGEMFLNGVGQGAPGTGAGGSSNRIFLTVWDGNGTDTYDLSNYTTGVTLDLRPGMWSDFSNGSNTQNANLGGANYARGHVFNALQFGSDARSLIENATGGSGNDFFYGNSINNAFNGNAGTDTVVFTGALTDYSIVETNTLAVTRTGEGTDTLTNIEQMQFSNVTIVDDFRGGNLTSAALTIDGAATIGTAQFTGDRDWFAVQLVGGKNYVIHERGAPTSSGTLSDTLVRLHNAAGTEIAYNDDSGFGFNSQLAVRVTTTGTYYVNATAFSSNTGTYSVSIEQTAATRFDDPSLIFAGFGKGTAAGGWSSQDTYPRRVADVNNDGRADVIGFGAEGVFISTASNAATGGLNATTFAYAGFGTTAAAGGWASDNIYRREAVDVNADGRADLVGFGSTGVYVALNTGGTSFGATTLKLSSFGPDPSAGGWSSDNLFHREVADVTGDGLADIVGFGGAGVYVSAGTGAGNFGTAALAFNGFGVSGNAGSWIDNDLYPRRLADVNGDGRKDIVGFGDAGVYVSLATGSGTTATFGATMLAMNSFGASLAGGGWSSQNLYTRTLGDVNADGRADIVAFGSAQVYVALGVGDGTFATVAGDMASFGAAASAGGWSNNTAYPRLMGDITGDGRSDILGFGDSGIYLSRSFDYVVV